VNGFSGQTLYCGDELIALAQRETGGAQRRKWE
jgi:hypothetical protein